LRQYSGTNCGILTVFDRSYIKILHMRNQLDWIIVKVAGT